MTTSPSCIDPEAPPPVLTAAEGSAICGREEQGATTTTTQDEEMATSSEDDTDSDHGSSVIGAIFNFTNCIIGAGAIGLGGAIAESGGAISVLLILSFGVLTKLSLDLVIRLSIETEGARGSYEDLASVGLGRPGRGLVSACKLLYSFGCLVAYIVVLKDNFGPALRNLIYGDIDGSGVDSWIYAILKENAYFTWIVSSSLILPLCMLRDMTPLANFSMLSVVSMAAIVFIVIYIYFDHPEIRAPAGTFYENWVEIRPGVLESLGTFVFTFVSQHTVHLVFGSLKPSVRTLSNWKTVSTAALSASTAVSLTVGVFLYITFWQTTKSDIFEIYPQTYLIDLAKLLLCITMIFTFPLPFFTCRELVVVTFIHPCCLDANTTTTTATSTAAGTNTTSTTTTTQSSSSSSIGDDNNIMEDNDLQEPLLLSISDNNNNNNNEEEGGVSQEQYNNRTDTSSIASDVSRRIRDSATPKNWLLPNDDRQLRLVGHMMLTGKLWVIATGLAIAAPSLGDVLDLVGCATGTIIAFLLPALLSFRIEGFSWLALILLMVGGIVGTVGTFYSVKKLVADF